MRAKFVLSVVLVVAVLAGIISLLRHQTAPIPAEQPQTETSATPAPVAPRSPQKKTTRANAPSPKTIVDAGPGPVVQQSTTNKLERLAEIRQSFRALAAGDPATALRAAKQIKNDTERETALLTLVSEWTRGELRSPQQRAEAISQYGLEAGLGMELLRMPELALLWANEMTESGARVALIGSIAVGMVGSDAEAAFALAEQVPAENRRQFYDMLFAGWAGKDTDAALKLVDQIADPAERDAALAAVRTVAPVGIGAALAMKDGLPVIRELLPGTPAQLSGQIHTGDRILAIAQGDSPFVDAQNLSLQKVVEMIRGAPNTVLQLQVLSADAPPGSTPRTVSITRDQLKFKR